MKFGIRQLTFLFCFVGSSAMAKEEVRCASYYYGHEKGVGKASWTGSKNHRQLAAGNPLVMDLSDTIAEIKVYYWTASRHLQFRFKNIATGQSSTSGSYLPLIDAKKQKQSERSLFETAIPAQRVEGVEVDRFFISCGTSLTP